MLAVNDSRTSQRDAGSALVTVLIVMSVLTIGGLALASIVVNTSGMVVASRSTAQSRAAADAGLSEALAAAVRDGKVCDDIPIEAHPIGGDLGDGSSYTVVRDCASTPGRAIYTATGRGPGGAVTTTEAVYNYTPVPVRVNEPALVTRAPLNLSALKITAVDPSEPASVWVIPDAGVSGDFTCNSGGAIAGSVYLPAGTVFGAGGCAVTGDVFAEKDVTIGSGTTIHGDLVSLSGKVNISGGSIIDGGVYAKGDITFSGGPIIRGDVASSTGSVTLSGGMTIDGSIHAKLNMTGTSVSPRFVKSIFAGGNVNLTGGKPTARDEIRYGGTFTFPNGTASEWAVTSVTKNPVQPVVTVPSLPNTPEWQGVTQADLDALVASGTFKKVTWSGACAYGWYPEHEMIAKIKAMSQPTIIDARACSRLDLHQYSGITTLKTDIVFVAPSFNIEDQDFQSADGEKHRLWFISPEVPNRNCAGVPPIAIKGTQMLPAGTASKISGMIFTQCTIDFPNGGEGWKGSIQAGTMSGKPNFLYEPVGFPGSTHPGEETPGGGAGVTPPLGDLISRRDVVTP